MTTLTQGVRTADFILSEANGNLSRENGVAGATLPSGEVVKVTANKLVSYNGSGTVVGVVIHACVLDDKIAYIARDAEVTGDLLSSTEATDGALDAGALAGLAALHVIVR